MSDKIFLNPEEWTRLQKASAANPAARELMLLIGERDMRVKFQADKDAPFLQMESEHYRFKAETEKERTRLAAESSRMKLSASASVALQYSKAVAENISLREEIIAKREKTLELWRAEKMHPIALEISAKNAELDRGLQMSLNLIRSMAAGLQPTRP